MHLKKSIYILLVIGAVFFECLSGYIISHDFRARPNKPYYQWSFYTPNGGHIGNRYGILKLMYHPQLVYVNFPNQQTQHFSTNSRGFRGREVEAKKAGQKRIVIVGGSAAFGTGLDSDSETFEAKMEKKLTNVDVINAAVIGHRSGQELTYLYTELIDLDPDLIIAFDGINDCSRENINRWPDLCGAEDIFHAIEELDSLVYAPIFVRYINIHKVIFAKSEYLFKNICDRSKPMVWRMKKWFGKRSLGTREDAERNIKESCIDEVSLIYARNISKMDHLAKAYNMKFLCAIQPRQDSLMNEKNDGDYGVFRTNAKNLFRLQNIRFIDLNEHGDVLKSEMFMDGMHPDEKGHGIIADILVEKILKEKLLGDDYNR